MEAGDEGGEVFRAEEAGGAAAEVEGLEGGILGYLRITLNRITPHSISLPRRGERANRRIFLGFEEDGLDVRCDGICAGGEGIEVAVGAFFDTKGNVDIETSQLIPPKDEMPLSSAR